MLLYSIQDSPRLQYISAFIGRELFQKPIEVTCDAVKFRAFRGPRINYSSSAIDASEFRIASTGLLFETGVSPQIIECFDVKGYKAFFRTRDGHLPFDILAAIFYLVTRYEEYLPHHNDHYNRYAHTESLAYRESFLHLPLVNIWLSDLRSELTAFYSDIVFRPRTFTFLPTYDIDIAYSYLGKGFLRNLGGLVRSAFKKEWKQIYDRLAVLGGRRRDPYDAYEWMNIRHREYGLAPIYFFLLADKQKGYDKNIDPAGRRLQALTRELASTGSPAIHPSWQSGDKPSLVDKEIKRLKNITGMTIDCSRQHYIRLQLPESYRVLIRAGIRKDFSLGYGSTNGFRASVASSFPWYDLEKEETTGLTIYPFCFMDANSFYEQKQSPTETLQELMSFYHAIKKINGLMISIWHNQFLGTDRLFAGWKEVYEVFLSKIQADKDG